MKIAVAQIEVVPGNPETNLKTCLDAQKRGFESGADIVVFPELCLSGYLIGDIWEENSYVNELVEMGNELAMAACHGVSCFGNVGLDTHAKGEDGRPRRYNAAWISDRGKLVLHPRFKLPFFPKTLLPNYREFEETRHFFDSRRLVLEQGLKKEDGVEPVVVHINKQQCLLGIYLCEDGWHEDYLFNVPKILADKGAECLINLSGSPFTLDKEQKRHRVFAAQAKSLSLPLVYVNCVGMQNNGKTLFSFDGNSSVYDEWGEVIHEAPHFQTSFEVVDLSNAKPVQRNPPSNIVRIHQCLKNSVGIYMRRFGLHRVVVGVSGGIDSAVSAAFFTDLLGPENVLLVNMPSRYNTDTTKNLAKDLTLNLNAWRATVSIEESVLLTQKQMDGIPIRREDQVETLKLTPFHLENVQARDRTARILSALACEFNAVFPSNANKSETMVGYATLYGDHAGFLAPFADLWKYQVYELGRYLNQGVFNRDVIPPGIFDIKPSAELSAEQNPDEGEGDPIIYEYHDKLFEAWMQRWHRLSPEEILEGYIAGSLETELELDVTLDALFSSPSDFIEDLERWWNAFKGLSVVKRVQAPPIAAICRRAFGFDYRESLMPPHYTRRYQKLKKELLQSS